MSTQVSFFLGNGRAFHRFASSAPFALKTSFYGERLRRGYNPCCVWNVAKTANIF